MSSRDSILAAVKKNQPEEKPLPVIENFIPFAGDNLSKFKEVLTAIGGEAVEANSMEDVIKHLQIEFPSAKRIIAVQDLFPGYALHYTTTGEPHKLEDVDIAIIPAHFGVAENGSVWVTEDMIVERAIPFICENLVVLVDRNSFLPTMHHAYDYIADRDYGFSTFIAGPSKTADIEQSLVLGAHGPKTMTVFLMTA